MCAPLLAFFRRILVLSCPKLPVEHLRSEEQIHQQGKSPVKDNAMQSVGAALAMPDDHIVPFRMGHKLIVLGSVKLPLGIHRNPSKNPVHGGSFR